MAQIEHRTDAGSLAHPETTLSARLRRFAPVALVALAMAAVFATGLHRQVSLETLVRHRMAIDTFVDDYTVLAVAAFMLTYTAMVALSLPGSFLLSIMGGILFGTLIGGLATVVSATTGATIIFLAARSACGESITRRAGPLAAKIAEGFRADAFSYLLFLRLVPAFPFFLVNLAPALVGVRVPTFVAATAIGIVPATFTFTFLGSGLDSVIARQESIYRACLAAGRADCTVTFDHSMILTPQLLLALAALGMLALVPIVVKRIRARRIQHS